MRIRKGLGIAVALAAAGLAGCAAKEAKPEERVIPVYSPRPELVEELPGLGGMYKSVWSDGEQLKLSLYVEAADGTRMIEASWSRFEIRDSADCLQERLDVRRRLDFHGFGLVGWAEGFMVDEGCDKIVDLCNATYVPDNGNPEDISAESCLDSDAAFATSKDEIDRNAYRIEDEVAKWRERKRR